MPPVTTTRRHTAPADPPSPSAARAAAIRRRLLAWYDEHKRDLPWRHHPHNPYAQWVAEVMLQQTRVETVIGYYERFMRRFPTVGALAGADHDAVLKHWEGLGYYRRALHLHEAARRVAAEYGGSLPGSAAALRALPGFGEYTSAAVAAIAYGEASAAVDGNVARVVARLFAVEQDVLSTPGRATMRRLADALLDRERPGDFNQAWMDLGSSICTPKSPDCPRCPLRRHCAAAATGRAESLPIRGRGRAAREVLCTVAIITRGRAMLVRRRPTGGLWSGLFEFPNAEIAAGDSPQQALVRLLEECRVASIAAAPRSLGRVDHQLTHRLMRFEVHAVSVDARGRSRAAPPMQWATREEIDALSLSTAHRRILALAP
jgi:A/G-specific adenine glycosylase